MTALDARALLAIARLENARVHLWVLRELRALRALAK